MLRLNSWGRWQGRLSFQAAAHDLDRDAVGIGQTQRRLAEFLRRPDCVHPELQGSHHPEADASAVDGQRDFRDLPETDAAGRPILPDEEGDQGAGDPMLSP